MDQPRDKMDRARLKQIETSDITESKVNQDFVDWLKTKGLNWLLVILAAICVYMLVVRWKQSNVQESADAWQALATADLPRSLEDVAEEYPDEEAVALLARMSAARRYIQSVRAGTTLGATTPEQPANPTQPAPPPPTTEPLSDSQRAEYLSEAKRLYQSALDSMNADVSKTPAKALMRINALEGLAAVEESLGNADAAANYYKQASAAAGTAFPRLAEQAAERESNVSSTVMVASLPTMAETGASALRSSFQSQPSTQSNINMSPSLQGIISGPGDELPEANSANGGAQPSVILNGGATSE